MTFSASPSKEDEFSVSDTRTLGLSPAVIWRPLLVITVAIADVLHPGRRGPSEKLAGDVCHNDRSLYLVASFFDTTSEIFRWQLIELLLLECAIAS